MTTSRHYVSLRTYALVFAVALSPALMQTEPTCQAEDPVLSWLEFEVDGQNQIVGFHPYTTSYYVSATSTTATLRVIAKPTWLVVYEWVVDGTPMGPVVLGFGAGEATLSVPPGSTLRVTVHGRQAAVDNRTYFIHANYFPCTEQGILDAIALGGGPHYFACDGPTTVVTTDAIYIGNDVILDGEGNLTIHHDGQSAFYPYGVTELRNLTVKGGTSAVHLFGAAELTLINSTMTCTGGYPSGACGAIWGTMGGEATLIASTATCEPSASGCYPLNVQRSTIVNSTVTVPATGYGVAISVWGEHGYGGTADVTIVNSTVTAPPLYSHAITLGLEDCVGGSCFCESGGRADVAHSTIVGSVLFGCTQDPAGTIANSIMDGNCLVSEYAMWFSNGYNIESGDTCGFDHATDQVNVTAEQLNLGPLQDNGGPTMTHALLPGSVAIDWIPEADCVDADGAPLTTDQRGEPRPETGGTMCDVGAFEVQP